MQIQLEYAHITACRFVFDLSLFCSIGVGSRYFLISSVSNQSNPFSGRGPDDVEIDRTDGTDTDFSYISAVKGDPKSNAQKFSDACRGAVAGDLLTAKKCHLQSYGESAGRVPCDLSGGLLRLLS